MARAHRLQGPDCCGGLLSQWTDVPLKRRIPNADLRDAKAARPVGRPLLPRRRAARRHRGGRPRPRILRSRAGLSDHLHPLCFSGRRTSGRRSSPRRWPPRSSTTTRRAPRPTPPSPPPTSHRDRAVSSACCALSLAPWARSSSRRADPQRARPAQNRCRGGERGGCGRRAGRRFSRARNAPEGTHVSKARWLPNRGYNSAPCASGSRRAASSST